MPLVSEIDYSTVFRDIPGKWDRTATEEGATSPEREEAISGGVSTI
jgi:hypothetical protein